MIAFLAIAVVVAVALLLWRINARTRAGTPKPGELAPAFALPDQDGASRSLGEFQGKWVVLYFYPRDDTPGCAEQAMRFRNSMRDLEALGAVVCGISVDDSASHAAFARKYNLPFALLADRAGEVAARYGSLMNLGIVRFAKRNTFLIDPQGKVSRVYLGVNAGRNAQQVSDDLKTITKE
jgi:peroxiredoxin Q/BCP